MTSPQGTVFDIEVLVYNPTADLEKDKEYIDFILPGTRNLYEFNLDPKDKDPNLLIFFSLDSLTGNAKQMYVNADSQPDELNRYFWSAQVDENQYNEETDIVLSQFELDTLHASGLKFFVAIESKIAGKLYEIIYKI